MCWHGVNTRGAIKIHTLLDLRGSIPAFIFITDGKYYDSNILFEIIPIPGAIYLTDKAYIDFISLYRMHKTNAFFISRVKVSLDYNLLDCNFNIDETTVKELLTEMVTNQNFKEQYNLFDDQF